MNTDKLLQGVELTICVSKYIIDTDYVSDEEYCNEYNVFGYVIEENKEQNDLVIFKFDNKIYCCVLSSTKYNLSNTRNKYISLNLYENIKNNYINMPTNQIYEFKNFKYLIGHYISRVHCEQVATYYKPEVIYVK